MRRPGVQGPYTTAPCSQIKNTHYRQGWQNKNEPEAEMRVGVGIPSLNVVEIEADEEELFHKYSQ